MFTIACPTCGQTATVPDDSAQFCPRCGAPLRSESPGDQFARGDIDLRNVAKHQRRLLWYVLALLAFPFTPLLMRLIPRVPVTGFSTLLRDLIPLALCVALIAVAVAVVQMMAALRWPPGLRFLVLVLLLFPCVNVVILFIINRRATGLLKAAGLRVGLMGVKDADVVRVLSAHLCHTCGYNLTGNVSGICPECGSPAPIPPPHPVTS